DQLHLEPILCLGNILAARISDGKRAADAHGARAALVGPAIHEQDSPRRNEKGRQAGSSRPSRLVGGRRRSGRTVPVRLRLFVATPLVAALLDSSTRWPVSLHFNKGLAGAPQEAVEAARDTATNPAVLDSFAL